MSDLRTLWNSIEKKRTEWIEHDMMVTGINHRRQPKNYRGRPRLEYMCKIMNDEGCYSYEDTKRKKIKKSTGKSCKPKNYCKSISGLNTKKNCTYTFKTWLGTFYNSNGIFAV